MKLIVRSTIGFLFLIALALPALAQAPNVAVRISPPSDPGCFFAVTIKNLQTTTVTCNTAYLAIFNQKRSRFVCEYKLPIGKKLAPFKTLSFKICCESQLPPTYISYVQVSHSLGNNEQWFYRP